MTGAGSGGGLRGRGESARSRRAVRIGITGPIGCGKSTVARWLGERPGVVVVDADQVGREVLDPGEPVLAAVIERFGASLLRADGKLDRAALGRLVFADPGALRDLEAIVHPAVRPRILAAIAAADSGGADAVIVEAIKLVEGGLAAECDEIWLVTCDPEVQRTRLIERGSSEADADQRIVAQRELARRIAQAGTQTIDSSGGVSETRRQAEAMLDAALRAGPSPSSTQSRN